MGGDQPQYEIWAWWSSSNNTPGCGPGSPRPRTSLITRRFRFFLSPPGRVGTQDRGTKQEATQGSAGHVARGTPQAEVVEGPLHTRWASRLRGTPSAPAPRHGGPCSPCRPQQTCSCGGGERQTRCPTAPGSGGQGRVGGLHDPLNQTGQSLADTHEGSAPTAPCQVLSLTSAKDAWRARRCQNQSHTPNVNHTAKSAGSCPEGEMDMSQALCRHPKPAPATH